MVRIFIEPVVVLLALFLVSNALPVEESSQQFLKLDFNVSNRNSTTVNPSLGVVSSSPISSTLNNTNNNLAYFITLLVGSESQSLNAQIDTGSSDLWFANTQSNWASSNQGEGYDSSASTTFQNYEDSRFLVSYASGEVLGNYVSDSIAIPGGPTLTNVTFGSVQIDFGWGSGMLGLGTILDEAGNSFGEYPNFAQLLKDQGYISKNAYSLYLNDFNASTGSLIFGGIDTAKYESLTTLPIEDPARLSISLTSVTSTNGTVIKAPQGTIGLLDTGSALTYLPDSIIQNLAPSIPGGSYNESSGTIVLSGPTLPKDHHLIYDLSGVEIKVPISELVVENFDGKGEPLPGYALAVTSNKFLLVSPESTDVLTLLGDSFLRSAYVVFNLDDRVVQIGQAKYTEDSNIVPIE